MLSAQTMISFLFYLDLDELKAKDQVLTVMKAITLTIAITLTVTIAVTVHLL